MSIHKPCPAAPAVRSIGPLLDPGSVRPPRAHCAGKPPAVVRRDRCAGPAAAGRSWQRAAKAASAARPCRRGMGAPPAGVTGLGASAGLGWRTRGVCSAPTGKNSTGRGSPQCQVTACGRRDFLKLWGYPSWAASPPNPLADAARPTGRAGAGGAAEERPDLLRDYARLYPGVYPPPWYSRQTEDLLAELRLRFGLGHRRPDPPRAPQFMQLPLAL